jgi:hypothetical protein
LESQNPALRRRSHWPGYFDFKLFGNQEDSQKNGKRSKPVFYTPITDYAMMSALFRNLIRVGYQVPMFFTASFVMG